MLRAICLAAEFTAVFVGLPILLAVRAIPSPPIPALVTMAAVMSVALVKDSQFDRMRFFNLEAAKKNVLPVVLRSIAAMALLGVCVALFTPELLFSFIRRAPLVWALVMVLYPVLSVYPQELVFRAFFFQRYRTLFPTRRLMILANAAVFGFVHLVFENLLAVGLSFLGGLIFATTYERSRSLLLVSVEHAVLGNFIFTVGLGEFFYHGVMP